MLNTKKILLLTAPCPKPDEVPLHLGDSRPPQGLGFIGSFLEQAGHIVKIIDLYQFDRDLTVKNAKVVQEQSTVNIGIDLDKEISEFQPDFIGMYIHTISFNTGVALAKRLKRDYPGIKLMCGGPHPTVLPETLPLCFDYVVAGEGEYAALEIVEGRAQGRIIKGTKVQDLNELPLPKWDWFLDKPYNWQLELFGDATNKVIPLNTSRGCPFMCQFCGVQEVSGAAFRSIKAEKLFEIVVELIEKYGVDGVYFREDNFTVNPGRVKKFCNLLIENNIKIKWACESRVGELREKQMALMAEAGCIGLYVGVESGSNRMLKMMQKGETAEDFREKFPLLANYGIKTYTTWVFGMPLETKDDRKQNYDLLEEINPTSADLFVYLGIPKSSFYHQMNSNPQLYEFKGKDWFIYPNGYHSITSNLYGIDDPRVQFTKNLYAENGITPIHVDF